MPSTTLYLRTVPVLAFSLLAIDPTRTGFTITNRTTTGTIVYLSRSRGVLGAPLTNYCAISLLQNDSVTLLECEGDDTTSEVFAVAEGAVANVEIIESRGR